MLTERQVLILKSIIHLYTKYKQPIGSKKLIQESGLHASSATIRNEMVQLEELGLLTKTHSSSGRVPSIYGYRYYVDYLIHPYQADPKDVASIKQSLENPFWQVDEIVLASAEALSELTNYTAISLGPEIKGSKLTGFRIVPLNERRVIAVLTTDKGHIESQVFALPEYVNSSDLEKIVRLFNDELVGETLRTVFKRLKTDLPILIHQHIRTAEGILTILDNLFTDTVKKRIHVEGRMNMLDYSNDLNIEQFKSLYDLMDGEHDLSPLLSFKNEGITVQIGKELNNKLLDDFSLISATYDVNEFGTGVIALLGPTSMPYPEMISLVDVFREELSKKIKQYYHSSENEK